MTDQSGSWNTKCSQSSVKSSANRNKCLNERRRRDQENLYFEELAELISASITDMTSMSVKPEKCAILQESLKQIKQIKEEAKTEAVQQAQVSSSKPSVLANRFFGPRILEALDGFLFVVNNQGKVDYVSDNITQYLKYTEDDLVGKSIYNFIHVGDHGQFSNCLLPMSVGEVFAWPADVNVQGRTFICRMLIKPPSEESDDVEIKQTCISQYESMQISAILHSGDRNEPNEATDCSSCLVCVARRLSFAEKTNTMLGIEQFTTKQDLTGKIIASDTSGIAPGHYCCPNLVGQHLQDFCHVNDIQTISKHIQEVLKTGVNTSTVYRFKFQDSRFVFVQTKSKLFTRNNGDNNDFVMSTHSIIRQCDNDNELKGSASSSLMKSIIGNSPLVREQRNTTPGVPNNIATMLGALNPNQFPLRSPVSPSPHQPSMEDSLDALDIFSSSSWDSPIPDSSGIISSLGSNGNSVYSLPSLTSPVSSNMNSMNSVNQMKLTNSMEQQQQQHQQHQQQQQQQRQMLLSQQLPNMANKQQQQLQMNFQKKSSFDSGQKSPVFSQGVGPKQNKAFSMPSPHGAMQGNLMGFSSQRSPGSVTSMAQNRMSPGGNMNMGMSYPLQRTSPAAGVTQNPLMASVSQNQTWVRMNSVGSSVGASPAQSPLQALQSMDTQQSNGMGPTTLLSPSFRNNMEFTFPPSSDNRLPGLDKRTGSARQGRLCQLLKGNSVSSEYDITHSPLIDSNAGVKDGDRKDISGLKSPTDSINQSPQPGPGVSPPDRPQSSTHGEENEVAPSRKSNDIILKQLLNQDEEDKPKNRKSSLLPLLGSDSESNSGEAVAKEEEMNEAEAKDNSKKSNILLQQLLSEDHSKGERKKHSSGELLTILLNEDPENNCTSAPAESTSQDSDLLQRRRHISGPQEPQSTTSNPLTPLTPLTPVSSQGSFPQPPTPTQPSSNMKSFLMSPPQSTEPTGPASGFGRSQKMEKPSQITNKNLDSFLRTMWEQEDDRPTPVQNKGVKRKSPPTDSVSKDDDPLSALSSSPSLQAQQPPQNSQGSGKTNQKNELLKRLLSKQTENETKICTTQYHTCNPSENPHQRFQNSNLESKILKVKRNEKVKDSNSDKDRKMDTSEVKDPMILLGQNEALTSAFTPNKLTSSASFDQSMLSQSSSQEQFSQLISTSSSSLSEIDQLAMGENDFLLEKILQEAVEMHQDFNKANSGMGGGGSQGSELNNNSSAGGMQMQQGESADDNCSILNAFDLDLDKMLGISTDGTIHTDANDKMAIEAIQKALMNDDTIQSNTSVGLSSHVQSSQAFSQALMFPKALPTSQAQAMTQMGASNLDLQFRLQQQQQQQQQIKRAGHVDPSMQQQGFSQAAPNNFGTQVPRIPGPQVPPVSALQQRPVFNNPNSTAMQVRQSLLQQQKMKQMRELDKQKRQTQYNMLQQRLQFSQRFPHQSIDNNVQSFPENLGDLMNSGNAPNVSIKQNNQIPGPMSPQFGPVPMQPLMGQSGSGPQMSPGQQQTSMNQMMGPSPSQMSPHFSQPAQNQWSMPGRGHTTPQSPMGVPQGAQFNIGRHRSMSGGNTPVNAKGNQFQFPDNQFGNQGQGQMGMFNQQQQQQQQSMFSQNRHLQRQLSLPPGRGSPRTSQSPFSPDMMSPHPISPNNAIRPTSNSQVSPPFGQHGTNMGQVNKMGQGFASDFDLAALDQLEGKHMGNVASSYIKQELRNMCNARFEKQALQQNQQQAIQQMAQIQQQQQQQKQQQQQQQQHQQQQQQQESSEIPFEIFEQISEMAKEHGISSMPNVSLTLDDFKEEDVLRQKREDAKERYQKLQALAKPQKQEHENPEVKATNLFKSQLTTTGTSIPVGTVHENRTRIQVVQKEPRTCEEMRPPDHKNSLLQKLLSE